MNYYLLAFPRSGSSLVRSILCYITGMKPLQPQGHSELTNICKSFINDSNTNYFYKFHFPQDPPGSGFNIINESNNKLILLHRNKYENILSYFFSSWHFNHGIKNKNFDDHYYQNFISSLLLDQSKFNSLKKIAKSYQNNIDYYKAWKYKKMILSYESIVTDPINYLFEEIQNSDNNIIPFVNTKSSPLFESIFENVMEFKSLKNDPFTINTHGKTLNKFRDIMPDEIKTLIDSIVPE